MPELNQTGVAQSNKIEQRDSSDPAMTRRGPDGRAHKTAEMEDRAYDAENNETGTDAVPLSVLPGGPPD